ncbi:MAG: hypothetical protein WD066_15620 [Planctomycetaceae bacterium]
MRIRRLAGAVVLSIGLWLVAPAEPTSANDESLPAELAAAETEFFAPRLTADEVRVLLGTLANADVRDAAEAELAAKAQGHESLIVEFAAQSPDLEVREACAEIVATLDARWRDTEAGRELAEAYRRHGNALLPAAWAASRKDPLDQRTVAVLMALEPESVWRWLSQRDDEHDPLRYLLLRLREASRDEFARARLFEHDAANVVKALPDVFPRSLPGTHHAAKRIVGHTAIGAIELHLDQSKSPATLAAVELAKRRLSLFEHDWRREPGVLSIGIDNCTYARGAQEIATRPIVRTNASVEGDAVAVPAKEHLPLLHLEQYHFVGATANHLPLPWWVDAYLPARWRDKVGARTVPFRGEQPPSVLPPAPSKRTAEEEAALAFSEWHPFFEPQPGTPQELAERRELADAQIKRALSIARETNADDRWRLALPHLEAAARIAPDHEPAVYEYCRVLREGYYREPVELRNDRLRLMAWAASDYLLRFQSTRERGNRMSDALGFAAANSPGIKQWLSPAEGSANRARREGEPGVAPIAPQAALSPDEYFILECCRRALDGSFPAPHETAPLVGSLVRIVYRGMRTNAVPLERRRAWLDGIIAQADHRLAQFDEADLEFDGITMANRAVLERLADLLVLRRNAALAVADDGNSDRAWELFRDLLPRIPYAVWKVEGSRSLDESLHPPGAWRARTEFAEWAETRQLPTGLVSPPAMQSQRGLQYQSVPLPDRRVIRVQTAGHATACMVVPLAVVKDRLYIVVAAPSEFGGYADPRPAVVPLDRDGGPRGQEVRQGERVQESIVWDTMRFLPQPPHGMIPSAGAASFRDRLCVADRAGGVSIFDPEGEKWTRIDLSRHDTMFVLSLHAMGEGRLICTATTKNEARRVTGRLHLLVDVESGKSEVLRRSEFEQLADPPALGAEARCLIGQGWNFREARDAPSDGLEPRYSAVWEHEGKWIGLGRRGLDVDLLARDPQRIELAFRGKLDGTVGLPPYSGVAAVRLGDRRYLNVGMTLHECDAAGEIRRSWLGKSSVRPAKGLLGEAAYVASVDGTLPIGYMLASAGPLLLSELWGASSLIAFDPMTETLYGPFDVRFATAVSAGNGAWISGRFADGATYVTAEELVAAAKRAGAVTTVAEHARRLEERIESMPQLPRATECFKLGRLTEARALVEAGLALPPDHPEAVVRGAATAETENRLRVHESRALFLLACLCAPDALDDAPKLLECAAKLAATDDRNPAPVYTNERRIALTGTYLEFRLHRRNEDWPKTRIAAERILARFPYIVDDLRQEVNAGYEESRRQLDRTAGNGSSPPTERPESRP